jgi:hypothetical protein
MTCDEKLAGLVRIKGFVCVGPEGHSTARDLRKWVTMGVDFALS